RAGVAPRHQPAQVVLVAFGHELDVAVVGVACPTGEAEAARLIGGRVAKADALHAAADAQRNAARRGRRHHGTNRRRPASSRVVMPSFLALSNFDPGSSPTTT